MAQLMPLPLTVSCFSKIQIGFTFPVPAVVRREKSASATKKPALIINEGSLLGDQRVSGKVAKQATCMRENSGLVMADAHDELCHFL